MPTTGSNCHYHTASAHRNFEHELGGHGGADVGCGRDAALSPCFRTI